MSRLLLYLLLLSSTGCQRHSQYDSQTTLLFRLPSDSGHDFPSFATIITAEQFARLSLNENPQLASTVLKAEIRLLPRSNLAVISVSASTPERSLEAIKMLVGAVTEAGRQATTPVTVSIVKDATLLK